MLELRHLRYFVAVAEELNFSRAAERLHMAQPPLSVAIRQLEQDLGTELLMRTTREVRLTDAGSAFLDGARRTLSELERAQADARRAAAGELGRLRVAFSWSERFETLPALGQAFRAGHPDVELLTEEMWNARMPAALRSGAVDVAVVWGPIASYFARSQPVPLVVVPVTPSRDTPTLPFVFDIALGVRRGEEAFRAELDAILQRWRPDINRILDEYGVPRVEMSEPRSAVQ